MLCIEPNRVENIFQTKTEEPSITAQAELPCLHFLQIPSQTRVKPSRFFGLAPVNFMIVHGIVYCVPMFYMGGTAHVSKAMYWSSRFSGQ